MAPAEVLFRQHGLTSLMKQGLDFWWFDCHWHSLIPGIQVGALAGTLVLP